MSFEIDKSAHKKAQKKSKMRNLAKDNANPHEKAAAEKKAGGPKLIGERKGYEDWTKAANDAYNRIQSAKADRNAANKDSTQKDTKEKGVKFYDKKGSGRLVNGRKVYNRR